MRPGVFLFFLLILTQFHDTANGQVVETDSVIVTLIRQRLGTEFTQTVNPEKSFALFQTERTDTINGLPKVSYAIVRILDKKVVEAGEASMSKLVWVGNYEVEVQPMDRQLALQRSSQSTIRKIDLRRYLKEVKP